jgi:signal peptidase I
MLVNLWLPLSSGQYEGLGRYCAVLFPFFLWASTIRSRGVFAVLVVTSSMLYGVCLALFTNMYPLF